VKARASIPVSDAATSRREALQGMDMVGSLPDVPRWTVTD
jgi:hypothetical protein